jgi:threonyl-tRNA synthetase
MLVVGDKEADQGSVAVRHRSQGDLGAMPLAEFTDKLLEEIRSKSY